MRSPIDQYIADKVLAMRKKRKVSQEKLAYELGYESTSYIAAIESMHPDRTECYNSKQLNSIALYLECSPKEFWPDKGLVSYTSERKYKPKRKKK
jgi:hypothetical protein